jgi:trk system potassium uptake protein TrkA
MKRYAVIGLGLLGRTVARELAGRGLEVIAIDVNQNLVQAIADDVTMAVRLDSTNADALKQQGIDKVDAALVAIGENFEAAVLTTATLKDLGIPWVISRATTDQERDILTRVRADRVVLVEEEMGKRVAQRMVSASLGDAVELAEGVSFAKMQTSKEMWGKSLAELKFRQRYRVNVTAVIRPATEEGGKAEVFAPPDAEEVIQEGDVIAVDGPDKAIESLADSDSG